MQVSLSLPYEEWVCTVVLGKNPDSNNPDSRNPDSRNPDSKNPDSKNPDSKNPHSKNPDSKNPDIWQVGKNPDSKYPDSKNPARKTYSKCPSTTTTAVNAEHQKASKISVFKKMSL
jgi:hypothetical protein